MPRLESKRRAKTVHKRAVARNRRHNKHLRRATLPGNAREVTQKLPVACAKTAEHNLRLAILGPIDRLVVQPHSALEVGPIGHVVLGGQFGYVLRAFER